MKPLVIAFNQENDLPSRGLLRDCTNFNFRKGSFEALMITHSLELPDVAGHGGGAQLQCEGHW